MGAAGMALSKLQRKIIEILASGKSVQMRDLVSDCFGKDVLYKAKRKYQAAYASASRSVRRLEEAGMVERLAHFERREWGNGKGWSYVAGGKWRQVKVTERGMEVAQRLKLSHGETHLTE